MSEFSTQEEFLDALSPMLVRGFRESLYAHLQAGSPVTLRDGTFPLLATLGHGPASAAQAAQRVGIDRSVATKQATVLVDAGLLQRRRDPQDARATLLDLTPLGQEVARGLRERLLGLIDRLEDSGVTNDDLHVAARVLTLFSAIIAADATVENPPEIAGHLDQRPPMPLA